MKLTDNDLLFLAAKAIGGAFDAPTESITLDGGIEYTQWNPLEDDGDALRLAIELAIEISPCPATDSVMCEPKGKPESIITTEALDDFGARRAIVRAAAEIGRAQP
ncbi:MULTISPECIES: hypothetical protein [unclassified Pseudomonas]|uniref:hypothetical protein n=1 Tax=unclassified Pseudomonas TaxID=196821 RepID=UPI002448A9B1|nr:MULTISPECIES: hypothetical protein [unclassified Pseudomonas]MDH0300662.1 hypothetical protein [Pseudomonas sp. GD04091]MDH1984187.1 hypothetical protein [Pseudomonas sp. GD03689]